jgi:hypothetical protein
VLLHADTDDRRVLKCDSMWPTEGAESSAPRRWSERGFRSQLLAIVGIITLLVGVGIGTWLSVRGGGPATPSVYGNPTSSAGAVWSWNGTRYTLMSARGPAPSSNHSDMAYDPNTGLIVLWDHGCAGMVMGFQGGCAAQVNKTWTWDGGAWTASATSSSPTATGQGAMVFDTRLGKVVYVNGGGQAWSWTGSAWSSMAMGPGGSGPGSAAASQTVAAGYDEGRHVLLLVRPTTTWFWDGATWTVKAGGIDSAGAAGQLAYDGARGQPVYVGGHATWTWDGTRWERHDQAPISGGALAYDSARATLVLVQQDSSACDRTACKTTTWTWSSTTWSLLPIQGGPLLPLTRTGGISFPAAFDAGRGLIVLFASAS